MISQIIFIFFSSLKCGWSVSFSLYNQCALNLFVFLRRNSDTSMSVTRCIKWLNSLLIVLFLSYYIGAVAFTHTHHYFSYSITHSHPYWPQADGIPGHTHSSAAFDTIACLDNVVLEEAFVWHLSAAWVMLLILLSVRLERPAQRFAWRCDARAPPACSPLRA